MWVDKISITQLKFNLSNNGKKYKLRGIKKNTIYVNKLKTSYISKFYYLVV